MNWNNVDLIEMVELYAEDNNRCMTAKLIASEQELSDKFDEEVAQSVIAEYGRDDQCAIDQAFNDWTDGLCKDGDLHPEQYRTYTYVGKYAEKE